MTWAPECTRRDLARRAAALAAAAALPLRAAPPPKDTLVIAMAFDDIITLDPAEAFEISTGELLGNCYERLLRYDVDDPTRLVPELAQAWSVADDGRHYRFELRPGLRFASGNPLTADDVAFSLQRAVRIDKSPAFILSQFGLTKANVADKVRAAGPLTVTLETDKAYAPSLVYNCLTANVAAVVDRALVTAHERDGDLGAGWLRNHGAGSGPMRIREWRANEIVTLERNDDYHGAKTRLLRVIYTHVKEPASQRLQLLRGDVDVARNLTPQDLDALAAHPAIRITATPQGTVFYFSLNQKHPILSRPEVREAFKWLVDYDAIGRTLIRHIGVVHQNFIPLGMLGAVAGNPYRLDIPRAKALLARAGVPDGFKVTIDMRSSQPVQGLTEAYQQTLARVGIRMQIIPGDGKQTLTRYRNRAHDMYIGQWAADYWDPHSNADTFARNPDNGDRAKDRPLAWRNAWDIPLLTQQSDAAALERDPVRRARMYEAIQAEFRRSSPFVMLYQQTEVAAYRSNVEGFRLGPTADTNYVCKAAKT